MKRIYYIACNELYSLFYSPIAWIMMVLFLILTSADYLGTLGGAVANFERGGPYLMFVNNLTDGIVSNPLFGYFPKVINNLYIFFPLMTMGLISRETSSGTIRLLYSSPVRITEMVLGKFLAMLVFTLSLFVVLSTTLISLSISLGHPDYMHMLAAVTGLFLVLATYAAIGLFISSLTSYQIVAAIVTLAIFAFLGHVSDLWQDVDLLRNVTFYMNLGAKGQDLLDGLFNLRDITYFLILITTFLSFTIIRIKSATESLSWIKKAGRYALVIVIVFMTGYITNKPQVNVYADATRDKIHTITPPTQAMLKKLDDGPLEITVFGNLLQDFWRLPPNQQNSITSSIWEPYIRFKPDINIKFVYYYNVDTSSWYYKVNPNKSLKEIAEKEAKTYSMKVSSFLDSTEVLKLVDVRKEEYRNFFQLRYKGKTTILRTFDDPGYWPGENEIAAAINRLIATPPKIDFITDGIARGPFSERVRDYKMIASQVGNRQALINQGYDFDTLALDRTNIPTDIAALVIADPRAPLSSEALGKINRYIQQGGNIMITAEPDRKEVIQPLLDTLGLSMENGLLIQPSEKFSSDNIFTYLTDTSKHLSPQFTKDLKDELKYFGDTNFRVAMGGASVIRYEDKNGFHADALLTTDKKLSWNRIAPISHDSLQLKVGKQPSDQRGSYATAVRLSRKVNDKEQYVIMASDADYLTKPLFEGWDPKRFNYSFGSWCFSEFSYGKFPANTLRPQTDDTITIKVADMSFLKILFYYILPGIIAIIGTIILLRRKSK